MLFLFTPSNFTKIHSTETFTTTPFFVGLKVLHNTKNLFCNVGLNCNLALEFNGLVSKGVGSNADPFAFFIFLTLYKL